jgi:hypothetical protein
MTTDAVLDHVLVPRPGGSQGLADVASFLAAQLRASGAEVVLQGFRATPHGFQLVWTAALALALLYALAAWRRRWALALGLSLASPALLLLEFELLRSPVSGLWPQREDNVVATFAGRPGGPTLIFSAHYDTTTHFGDHMSWGPWGWRLGPATGLAIGMSLLGVVLARRGRSVPRPLALLGAGLAGAPVAAMWWFHAAGPLLREPSPGAIDNGGSVAALVRLAEGLALRPADAATTVRIVFFAAEEERALGSWAYARSLSQTQRLAAVNLESVGASDDLALVLEDGFALRRWRSPQALVDLVDAVAREQRGAGLAVLELPVGVLTDGRSFLAHGIPALTLRARIDGAFPRQLHSARDSRDRLSVAGIENAAALLLALVAQVDREPGSLDGLRGDAAAAQLPDD